MNKYKKLLKNISIFFVSQFASKILVFFMLPLYTSYMSTEDYAAADMVTTSVRLLLPFLTLSLSGAVLRFVMESYENLKSAVKFAMRVIFVGTAVLLLCHPLICKLDLFNGAEYLFYLYYLTSVIDALLNTLARAMERIKLVGVVGVLRTFTAIAFNIVFLVGLDMGVTGYLLAYIISFILAIIVFVCCLINDIIKVPALEDTKILKKNMLKYSIPLIPNSLSWWLVNYCNKYAIKFFLGASKLGLYSAASKIPAVLTTVQGIIGEALILSMVEEYQKEGDTQYYSLIYKIYNIILVFCCSGMIIFTKVFASILLAKDFYVAWRYVPFLLISVVFGGMAGYVADLYCVSKRNKGMFFSTLFGGIVSVVLTLSVVNSFGVLGVASVNMIVNLSIWLFRLIDSRRYVKLQLELKKDIVSYMVLIVQAVIMVWVQKDVFVWGIEIILFLALIWVRIQDLGMFIQVIKCKLLKKAGE